MEEWTSVPKKQNCGIAIYNFHQEGEHRLKLYVGEILHIILEEENWFFGYPLYDDSRRGIFPKSYVHILDYSVESDAAVTPYIRNQPPIVQEITTILKEWGALWKNLYVFNFCWSVVLFNLLRSNYVHTLFHILQSNNHDKILNKEQLDTWLKEYKPSIGPWPQRTNAQLEAQRLPQSNNEYFDAIRNRIYDLIAQRNKIVSGTLPTDELKSVTRDVAARIDEGNKMLRLDLVLRDRNGNIINPDEASTIQLYLNHKNAIERMTAPKADYKDSKKTAIQQFSHIFILSVKNFTCKMTEDAELLISLYDAKEYKPITENYVVRWSKNGLMSDLSQMNNLRVLFTDLGKKDLERERIYLVCYVVRIGAMETKEADHRRRSSMSIATNQSNLSKKGGQTDGMRRPFGVAAKDVTVFMRVMNESSADCEKDIPVPFYICDKDTFEQTLKKIINKEDKNEAKDQSLFVSMKLLQGDLVQAREEHAHLFLGAVTIARKMGFPEVILPGDVRNDLYLTIMSGEFTKGSQASNKNIEVNVTVCNEKGTVIPGVISIGGGTTPINSYQSVIYYHDDKPQWFETFKVAIQIEEFKTSHIKFLFKHRSSNEAKDKSEKPFALAYAKLMQENGTTLKDDTHKLCVYKIDHKKFDESSLEYYKLPTTLNESELKEKSKVQVAGLNLSSKDSFTISSNICSTKLTQNVNLLGLLNWTSNKHKLADSLAALTTVDGEEVVKFLQDILDALFSILMENPEDDTYDLSVFLCLLSIVGLVSTDWKFQHFEPVLELYVRESFSATLAYGKLLAVLTNMIKKRDSSAYLEHMFKTMKSLQYIMKFISRSRQLFLELHGEEADDNFTDTFRDFLRSAEALMMEGKDSLLKEQGALLKYCPYTIPDILKIFDAQELSRVLSDMLSNIPENRLTKQKMMTINEIVHSELFLYPECREILLPVFTKMIENLFKQFEEGLSTQRRKKEGRLAKVAKVLGETQHVLKKHKGYSEEVLPPNTLQEIELCVKILSDILDLLFRKDISPSYNDLTYIINNNLRVVIQTYANMNKENPSVQSLVAIMIDIFRQINQQQYESYIECLTSEEKLHFLVEIHVVFRQLVDQSVYNSDWCEMIMMQNFVILKALRFFSYTIRDFFFDDFEQQAWNNFFHCAIAFMTQSSLQLENFSPNKRMTILKRYGDMRREMGCLVRLMWFNLGSFKRQFVPGLVCNILEMTLIPEKELRLSTIPIFFDMMQCEFYSSKYEIESFGNTKTDFSHVKGNFQQFENEMIAKLDTLVEGGRGDEEYKRLFEEIMLDLCSRHSTIKEDGVKFVKTLTKLMESLLEYRCIINDENKENRMICIVNLLHFYSEINRKEMFIRYINKLYNLHLECENYTEAAYTLMQHSDLLNWSDERLPNILKCLNNSCFDTHRELKEFLYQQIIDNFKKGKMWECALEKSKELMKQYEEETYDYVELSVIHSNIAEYYQSIMKNDRAMPEYFRVAYYGYGFPPFLTNKVFIYRGKECERLHDFSNRILNAFPKATALNYLDAPKEDVVQGTGQFIQINKVDPIMEVKKHRFSGKPVSEAILSYYHRNHVQTFEYSRPYKKKDELLESDNEFASLWLERTNLKVSATLPGTLRWLPVTEVNVRQISPLEHAVEAMEQENQVLYSMIKTYMKDADISIKNLSLKLTGILDPSVMGGIANYEACFFIPEYLVKHPQDEHLIRRLKDLIACQIPLLKLGVQIHGERATDDLQPLQVHLIESFAEKDAQITEKYGKRESDLKFDSSIVMRHQNKIMNRHSDTSLNPDNLTPLLRLAPFTRGTAGNSSFISIRPFNFTTSNQNVSKTLSSPPIKHLIISPSKSLTSTPATLKKKKGKDKRQSGKVENSPNSLSSGTQWYTTSDTEITSNGIPLVELRQELLPTRPLRSEMERERRLSRTSSGQFSRPSSLSITLRPNSSSGTSSNRDSIGTTDSSISEEDNSMQPPPLPIKHQKSDSLTMPVINIETRNNSFLYSPRNTAIRNSNNVRVESESVAISNLTYEEHTPIAPPTPPPKPPKKKQLY